MDEKNKETVLSGDYLGTTEEFLSGVGTFSEEGKIYASILGDKNLDQSAHVAMVEGNLPENIDVDTVVFGEVFKIDPSFVRVIVKKIKGSSRSVDEKADIHVSNIMDGYVENASDNFGTGDIIKAKVSKLMSMKIDLTTRGDFGVVMAFCKRCRNPMKLADAEKNLLKCENCGSRESRKVASDYGNVIDI